MLAGLQDKASTSPASQAGEMFALIVLMSMRLS